MTTSTVKLHARKSPSGSVRWAICHASLQREKAVAAPGRKSTPAADWGTVAHDLGEHCLKLGDAFVEQRRGCRVRVLEDGTCVYAPVGTSFYEDSPIVVDDEMIDAVMTYVEFVRKLALGGELHVEQRLSIEHMTGEDGAAGTTDAGIVFPDELCVIDAKFGFDRVLASYPLERELFEFAPDEMKTRRLFDDSVKMPNTQLTMYAEAMRKELEFFHEFKRIRLIVVQPRLGHIDEYVMDMADFDVWVQWIREQAAATESDNPRVVPGEKQCKYCEAFPCPEAQAMVLQSAFDDFDSIEDDPKPRVAPARELGRLKRIVPLVRMWCDSIESRVHAELTAGREVDGWKLVDGDMGDRKWASEEQARDRLAKAGLTRDEYLNSKVISPAQAEKLVVGKRKNPNKKLTADQWDDLQTLIRRDQGAPKVVPSNDPRPAVAVNHADDFDVIDGDNSDFFN